MKSIAASAVTFAILTGGCASISQVSDTASGRGYVETYLAEFNEHDVDGMRTFWADDIQWLTLSGDRLELVSESADQLANMMTDYFATHPDVSSQASNVIESGDLLAFVESASWTDETGAKGQSALAIYHVENGKISRFWYLAAE